MKHVFAAATALVVSLLFVPTSSAQMTVASMSPGHGAAFVDSAEPLVITFSQPLDTLAVFDGQEGFFIKAEMTPDPGPPVSYSLNEAGTELSVVLDLAADTQYTLLVLNAKAQSGEYLDHPYAWTFSTGALGTGSVTGTITFPDDSPENAIVGLLPPDFLGGLFADEEGGGGPPFAAVTIVASTDGSYQLDYVPSGTYLPATFRDVNGDGEPDAGVSGEGLGMYDPDQDRVADLLAISDGQTASGIDLEIHPGNATASESAGDAAALAQGLQADAALSIVLGPEATPEGEAGIWLYVFYSDASEDTLGVAAFFDYFITLDSVPFGDGGGPTDVTSALPDGWIDSPAALASTEAAGGFDFRMARPDTRIELVLLNADLGMTAGKTRSVAEVAPIWSVSYSDNFESATFIVDALTGDVLFTIGISSAAMDYVDAADQVATAWRFDARMLGLSSQGPVDADGRAPAWTYHYYSASADSVISVTEGGGLLYDWQVNEADGPPSAPPFPDVWVDSGEAMAAADAASGSYRGMNPEAEVSALLTYGLSASAPDRLLWRFEYRPWPAGEVQLTIFVDGLTGAVTTGTEDPELPASNTLLDSFPNPTSGAVTVQYELESPGEAEVTVMNSLGQTVRRLVRSAESVGSQKIYWDGTDDGGRRVASGTYWIRLLTDQGVVTRPVTLVR